MAKKICKILLKVKNFAHCKCYGIVVHKNNSLKKFVKKIRIPVVYTYSKYIDFTQHLSSVTVGFVSCSRFTLK